MTARVTVLGSGTCVPRRRRGPAGFVVETGDSLVLVDSGSGTLGRLAQAGLDYRRLSHVLYTHTHVDHTADLGPLLFALNYTPGWKREEALRLIGPSEFGLFVERLSVAWPWILPAGDWLELQEVADDTIEWPDLVLHAKPVEHAGIPANAYRLETGDGSIVFSGDTCYCEAIVEIADGADLLVIEAAIPHGPEGTEVHLTAAQAGRVAAEARVSKVVLTHLYPTCDLEDMAALCRQEFDGEILVAEDLLSIEVGRL